MIQCQDLDNSGFIHHFSTDQIYIDEFHNTESDTVPKRLRGSSAVSLDSESDEGCTEILPGFHKHIGAWWKTVEERGHATNGYVHSMDGLMLPADAALYGEFVPVPCNQGDVRITMPEFIKRCR